MADEEKIFNLEEAEKLLPTLELLLETAREHQRELEALNREFAEVMTRIQLRGGIVPPYAELAEKRLRHDHVEEKVGEGLGQIEQLGCVVKDLDHGLVDFPSRRDDETVYLCWKLGEERIRYWHHTHEGFAGRKPLAPDELNQAGKTKLN